MNGGELRVGHMFAGIGGFPLGLKMVNQRISQRANSKHSTSQQPRKQSYRNVWANEIDKHACKIYRKNLPDHTLIEGDIKEVDPADIPDIDILTGGFPCQPFSVAGKREGFQDIRGTLFFEIMRIAKAKRPKILFLENVKGLLNHDNGDTFETILRTLGDAGYWYEYKVLNSKFFGVPQNRERVFIIGHLREGCTRQVFPITEPDELFVADESGESGIASCLDANYQKGARRQRTFVESGGSIMQFSELNEGSQAGRVYNIEGIAPTLHKSGGCTEPIIALPVLTPDRPTKRQNGRRFKENGEPMFTLTGQDIHGIAVSDSEEYKIRRLTPTECERLQGFPDGWTEGVSDTQRYKCLGNAVTVNVIEAIGELILEALD